MQTTGRDFDFVVQMVHEGAREAVGLAASAVSGRNTPDE